MKFVSNLIFVSPFNVFFLFIRSICWPILFISHWGYMIFSYFLYFGFDRNVNIYFMDNFADDYEDDFVDSDASDAGNLGYLVVSTIPLSITPFSVIICVSYSMSLLQISCLVIIFVMNITNPIMPKYNITSSIHSKWSILLLSNYFLVSLRRSGKRRKGRINKSSSKSTLSKAVNEEDSRRGWRICVDAIQYLL